MLRPPVVIAVLCAASPVRTRCSTQFPHDDHSEPIKCPPPPASPPLATDAPQHPPLPPVEPPRPPGARYESVSVPDWALPHACADWGVLLKATDIGTHSDDNAFGLRYLVQVGVLHFRTHLKVFIELNLPDGSRDLQHMFGFPQQLQGAARIEEDDDPEHAYAFVTTAPPVQYPSETFAERMDRRMRGFSFIVHTDEALTKDKLHAHCSAFAKRPSPPPSKQYIPSSPHSPYSTFSSSPPMDPLPSLQAARPALTPLAPPTTARPSLAPAFQASLHSSPNQPSFPGAPPAGLPASATSNKDNSYQRPASASANVPGPAAHVATTPSPPLQKLSLYVPLSQPRSPQLDTPLPFSPPAATSHHDSIKPSRSSPPPPASPNLLAPLTEPVLSHPSPHTPPTPHGHASSTFTVPPDSTSPPSLHTSTHHASPAKLVRHPASPPTAHQTLPIGAQHGQKPLPVPSQEHAVPPAFPPLKSMHVKTTLSSEASSALFNRMQGLSLKEGFSSNVAAFRTSHRAAYVIVLATVVVLCVMCCCFTCICLYLLASEKLSSRSGHRLFWPSHLDDNFAQSQCVPALESSEDMSEPPAVSSESLDYYGTAARAVR